MFFFPWLFIFSAFPTYGFTDLLSVVSFPSFIFGRFQILPLSCVEYSLAAVIVPIFSYAFFVALIIIILKNSILRKRGRNILIHLAPAPC